MKKVLILAYFYPPGNFAGSYRALSWAKYFHQYGYYPVIVSRQWKQSNGKYSEETVKEDFFEIHYLNYKNSFRDKLLLKFGYTRFKLLRKTLTSLELLLRNISDCFIPYSNFLSFSKKYLKQNTDCQLVIASGTPFQLFKYGYKLKRKFPDIQWFADYRDEWTTTVYDNLKNPFFNTVFKLDSFFEKKWMKSATAIFSVSQHWTDNISQYTGKTGFLVMNGFDEDDYNFTEQKLFDEFTIVYNGTLYPSQPVEIFLEASKKIIDKYQKQIPIKIIFPGIIDKHYEARETVVSKIRNVMNGYEKHILLTERLPKKEIVDIQLKAHVLLMIGHKDSSVKSVYSSKIFEYLGCKKPILLCPCDHDVLEELIISTQSGYIADSAEEAFKILEKLLSEYLSKGSITYMPNQQEVSRYTRKKQAEVLCGILDSYSRK